MSANGCQKRVVAVVGVAAMAVTVSTPLYPERPKSLIGRFRSGEPGAQRARDLLDRAPRERRDGEPAPEAVDRAVVAVALDLHPGLAQRLRVGLALVAQRVEAGGEHERGRRAGEVLRAQRRGVGVQAVGAVE